MLNLVYGLTFPVHVRQEGRVALTVVLKMEGQVAGRRGASCHWLRSPPSGRRGRLALPGEGSITLSLVA